MEVKAIEKGLRISPIKLRLTIDLIRNKDVQEARNILNNMNNKPARLTKKALDSAIANAVHNNSLDENKLYVKEIRVDQAKTLKRTTPDSRGHVAQNYRRFSHLVVVVEER